MKESPSLKHKIVDDFMYEEREKERRANEEAEQQQQQEEQAEIRYDRVKEKCSLLILRGLIYFMLFSGVHVSFFFNEYNMPQVSIQLSRRVNK